MKFTGERFIVGQAAGDITIEHTQRYKVALNLVKNKDVLDAACGEGYGSFILSKKANSVIGVDISQETIEYASQKYSKDNLSYICSSIAQLPLDSHSIDIVISFETIEHVDEIIQKKFMSEIKRILRPSGILLMSSPDKHIYSEMRNFHNPYHVHELYRDEFELLLKQYFLNVSLFSQGIGTQRIGVIEEINKNQQEMVYLLNNFQLDDFEKQYILALCSDISTLSGKKEMLNSIMPFIPEKPVRLFVDMGTGFSEDNVLIGIVSKERKNYSVRFNINNDWKNINKLRFDPVEKECCICNVISIKSNVNNLKIGPCNAYKSSNEGDYFYNDDPQYLIEGNLDCISYLVLEYTLCSISSNEVTCLLNKNLIELHEVKSKYKEQNDILQNIYSSHGYSVLKRCYKLRDRIFPSGSKRRSIVKFIVKGAFNFQKIQPFINVNTMKNIMVS